MSLEEALKENTEAVKALTEALAKGVAAPAAEPKPKKETAAQKKKREAAEKKAAEAAEAAEKAAEKAKAEPPVKKAPPSAANKEPESVFPSEDGETPIEEVEPVVTQGGPPEESEQEVGSEWYIYTMKLCSAFSQKTGDPAQTQAIIAKHGIVDMMQADDVSLSKVALEIEPHVGINRDANGNVIQS